jgi:hypothetical protein
VSPVVGVKTFKKASFSKRPKNRDDVLDVVIRDLLPAQRLMAPADRDLVQLFVVPWDVNRKEAPWIKPNRRDRDVQLETFVCIDTDFLFEDLREVEQLKGFKAAYGTCQYAGGLPNNARIVTVLPVPLQQQNLTHTQQQAHGNTALLANTSGHAAAAWRPGMPVPIDAGPGFYYNAFKFLVEHHLNKLDPKAMGLQRANGTLIKTTVDRCGDRVERAITKGDTIYAMDVYRSMEKLPGSRTSAALAAIGYKEQRSIEFSQGCQLTRYIHPLEG